MQPRLCPTLACPPASLQVLVYFAVAKLGERPTDGKTDVNPEGLTAGESRQYIEDILGLLHMACLYFTVIDILSNGC